MGEFTEEEKLHHYMGIEMNILTWNLLGKDNRDEKDNAGLLLSFSFILRENFPTMIGVRFICRDLR